MNLLLRGKLTVLPSGGTLEKNEWRGKFHCSMEVNIRGGRGWVGKGKLPKESGWVGGGGGGGGGGAFEVDDECFPSPSFTASSCMKVVCFYTSVCVCVCMAATAAPYRLLAQGLLLSSERSKPGNPGGLGSVAELREDEDEAYFSSYGHYGIHEEMLKV